MKFFLVLSTTLLFFTTALAVKEGGSGSAASGSERIHDAIVSGNFKKRRASVAEPDKNYFQAAPADFQRARYPDALYVTSVRLQLSLPAEGDTYLVTKPDDFIQRVVFLPKYKSALNHLIYDLRNQIRYQSAPDMKSEFWPGDDYIYNGNVYVQFITRSAALSLSAESFPAAAIVSIGHAKVSYIGIEVKWWKALSHHAGGSAGDFRSLITLPVTEVGIVPTTGQDDISLDLDRTVIDKLSLQLKTLIQEESKTITGIPLLVDLKRMNFTLVAHLLSDDMATISSHTMMGPAAEGILDQATGKPSRHFLARSCSRLLSTFKSAF